MTSEERGVSVPGCERVMSNERLTLRSVTPAKAGVQLTLFWIPAFAGMTLT